MVLAGGLHLVVDLLDRAVGKAYDVDAVDEFRLADAADGIDFHYFSIVDVLLN